VKNEESESDGTEAFIVEESAAGHADEGADNGKPNRRNPEGAGAAGYQ